MYTCVCCGMWQCFACEEMAIAGFAGTCKKKSSEACILGLKCTLHLLKLSSSLDTVQCCTERVDG